jgi:hypothetical protein
MTQSLTVQRHGLTSSATDPAHSEPSLALLISRAMRPGAMRLSHFGLLPLVHIRQTNYSRADSPVR